MWDQSVPLGLKEIKDLKGHKESKEIKGHKESKGPLVLLVLKGHKESKEYKERLDQSDLKDQQVPLVM